MALVTNEGEQWYIDKAQNVAPNSNALMDRLNFGTGATAEAETVSTATATASEVSESRVTGTLSQPSADTDRLVGTQTFTGAKNVTQVFRTNTSTKGGAGEVVSVYALFTAIPVDSPDQIEATIDVVAAGA